MARPFDPRHRHWWILPTPGDTDLTYITCGQTVPLRDINPADPFAHPALSRTRQSRRVVREALSVVLPLSSKIRQDSGAPQHRMEHRT